MMKNIKIVCLLLLFVGCNTKGPCNVEALLFGYPTEPKSTIYEIDDIWVHSDSIVNVLCEENLTSQFLKIDSFYFRFTQKDLLNKCSGFGCILPSKSRERIQVIVNSKNTIIFEGEKVSIDMLDSLVTVYYLNDDKDEDRPSRLMWAELTVDWDSRANQEVVKKTISEMAFGYSSALQSLYPDKSSSCDSVRQNKRSLMRKYPFLLSVRFGRELKLNGKSKTPPPPPDD